MRRGAFDYRSRYRNELWFAATSDVTSRVYTSGARACTFRDGSHSPRSRRPLARYRPLNALRPPEGPLAESTLPYGARAATGAGVHFPTGQNLSPTGNLTSTGLCRVAQAAHALQPLYAGVAGAREREAGHPKCGKGETMHNAKSFLWSAAIAASVLVGCSGAPDPVSHDPAGSVQTALTTTLDFDMVCEQSVGFFPADPSVREPSCLQSTICIWRTARRSSWRSSRIAAAPSWVEKTWAR